VDVDIEPAGADDFQHFLDLAAEVEDWFGPMVDEPGFHEAVRRNIARASALVALDARQAVGALLFSLHRAPVYEIGWLVVTASRCSEGIGGALVALAVREWISFPAVLGVVTFGAGHPGAGSRRFYERLGFEPVGIAEPGPDGRSRERFELPLERLPDWAW
jgi:GNAT superfamily N-acetyltransferase